MSNPVGFESLEVFQRAYKISLEIHKFSLKFPAIEQYAIADQTRRDIDEKQWKKWRDEYQAISRMLHALYKSAK